MSQASSVAAQCLLCDSSETQVVYDDPKAKMVTSDCKPWSYAATVIVCTACGHLQKLVNDELNLQTTAAYSRYDLYDLSDGGEQYIFGNPLKEAPRTRSDQILDRLRELVLISSSGRMLDVGCGNGAMVQAFGKVFPRWTLFGYEQNSRYRSRVMGLPGVAGFYEERLEAIAKQFDLITLIHVLEHVRDPKHLLRTIQDLLGPDGILVIQVPNAADNPFDMVILDHYSHFSDGVLSRLVRSLGFEVLTVSTDWVVKEITLVLRKGSRAQSNPDAAPIKPDLVRKYRQNADWLKRVAEDAARRAVDSHFGIFGTAIAGTWLGAVLGDSVRFFVDEDSRRVGKAHLGKPILHPSSLSSSDCVFLAFPHAVAMRVFDRLSGISRADYVLPPTV